MKLSLQQPQCLRYIEVDGLAPEISPQGQYWAVGYSHKMITFQLDFQSGEYFGPVLHEPEPRLMSPILKRKKI